MKSKRVLIISLIFAVILALAVLAFFVFAGKNCSHEWESWKTVKLSTCTEEGFKTRECKLCGEVEGEEIALLNHDYELLLKSEATCEMAEINEYVCAFCGNKYSEIVEEAKGHLLFYCGGGFNYDCLRCDLKGVQGEVVLTDLTARYGKGESFVAGFFDVSGGKSACFVSLILNDGQAIDLTAVEILRLEDINALAFSRAQIKEIAEGFGYFAGEYGVRLTYVTNLDGALCSYAIDFNEQSFDFKVTSSTQFTIFVDNDEEERVTIAPFESGAWIFSSDSNHSAFACLYDEEGNQLAYDYGDYNFNISCELVAGNKYYLIVKWQYNYSGGMNIIITAPSGEHIHNYSDWVHDKASGETTCSYSAKEARYCFVCGEVEYRYQQLLEHAFIDGSCVNCGYIEGSGDSVLKIFTDELCFNLNELIQAENNAEIESYLSSPMLELDSNDGLVKYSFVTALKDVTADYIGRYGIEEGDESLAWEITISKGYKWQNGDLITASDFIYSMQEQLNPLFLNAGAERFVNGAFSIYGAHEYLYCAKDGKVKDSYLQDLWNNVAMWAEGDDKIIIVLSSPLELLDDNCSLTQLAFTALNCLPLIHKDTYEACKIAPAIEGGLWGSSYKTSVETTISWGVYKLVDFEAGEFYLLEENEYYCGFDSGE